VPVNEQQVQQIERFMRANCPGLIDCPACSRKRTLAELVLFPRIPLAADAVLPPTTAYPAVILTCEKCGSAQVLSAEVVGVTLPSPYDSAP
jgi:hypothetical protein